MLAPGALRNAVRLLTALAVMLSGLSGLRAAPAFHESGAVQAVEAAAETVLAADDHLAHPHSHDADFDGGQWPGHPHEHKDHSHVALGLPAPLTSLLPPQGTILRLREECRAPSYLPFPLERPPCGLSVA